MDDDLGISSSPRKHRRPVSFEQALAAPKT